MIRPYYEEPNIKIYCGDCLEKMKEMSDESVDLTITSPPYNLGKNPHTGNKKHNVYFDSMDENNYQAWQIEGLNEIFRLTKNKGSLFYNHKNRIRHGLSIIPYEWILKTKWLVKQEIVWWNRSQNFDKCRFYPHTERIYWLVKNPTTKLYNKLSLTDIWKINPVGAGYEHKRQFPLHLVMNIASCFNNKAIIFDPFLGSGTTLVACKELGRKGIGIEMSKEYCDMAIQRLKNTTQPLGI